MPNLGIQPHIRPVFIGRSTNLITCLRKSHFNSVSSPPSAIIFSHKTKPQRELAPKTLQTSKKPRSSVTAHAASSAMFPSGWALWSCICACAAVSQIIERRTKIGVFLSAPLLATLLALFLAAGGLIPSISPAYDTIWKYLMPLGAAFYLLESDLSKLITSAKDSLLAFFNGALGTIVGTIIAYWAVGKYLGPDGAKVAAALCASYIGGSVNFAATAGFFGLTATGSNTLAAAMTADNLAMAAYIAILMSIPATLKIDSSSTGDVGDSNSNKNDIPPSSGSVTSETIGLSLAISVIACGLGNFVASLAGFSSGGLAFTSIIASGVATLAAFLYRRRKGDAKIVGFPGFAGSESMGGALMMLFFTTIGAGAGSLSALQGSGWLLVFIAIQLSVQLGISLQLGKLFKISMPVILIAANANVGGSATAAAMAAAKGWKSLLQPAVLLGALGYAIANGIGFAMGNWLMTW